MVRFTIRADTLHFTRGDGMSESISSEEQRQIDTLSQGVATDLANCLPAATISSTLVKNGWDPANADAFVANVQASMNSYENSAEGKAAIREAKRARNQRHMVVGALWCIGGTLVTVMTYSAASSGEGGGTYVVALGAIIFGALEFFAGLFGLMSD